MAKRSPFLKRLILFFVMTLAVVTALKLLDWLGDSINDEGVRRFTSVEAARKHLAPTELYLPAYRPERFQWPPSEILARRSPHNQLVIHVSDSHTHELILAIGQTEASAPAVELRLKTISHRRETTIQVEGRTASLTEGECNIGGTCYQLTWTEGSTRIRIVANLTPEELSRVAESMLPG